MGQWRFNLIDAKSVCLLLISMNLIDTLHSTKASQKLRHCLRLYGALFLLALLVSCAAPKPPLGGVGERPDQLNSSQTPGADSLNKRPLKLGLALGGGAAKGFAHVGVIEVLEEAGIRPQLVVGTSAGSVVGAFYASGKSAEQLQHLSETMDEKTLADWNMPLIGRGVMRGDALAKYVGQQLSVQKIEDMKIPLGIVATDLHTGQAILFQRGDVSTAVRASSAVPAVFQPVTIADKDYVDGGLVSPVPVRFARQMGADLVIAVDISTPPENNKSDGMLQILLQTFNIMGKTITDFELKGADVVVKPVLSGVGSTSFSERKRSIEAGRAAMLAQLPQLKALLQAKQP
jgi:NTE family protein